MTVFFVSLLLLRKFWPFEGSPRDQEQRMTDRLNCDCFDNGRLLLLILVFCESSEQSTIALEIDAVVVRPHFPMIN